MCKRREAFQCVLPHAQCGSSNLGRLLPSSSVKSVPSLICWDFVVSANHPLFVTSSLIHFSFRHSCSGWRVWLLWCSNRSSSYSICQMCFGADDIQMDFKGVEVCVSFSNQMESALRFGVLFQWKNFQMCVFVSVSFISKESRWRIDGSVLIKRCVCVPARECSTHCHQWLVFRAGRLVPTSCVQEWSLLCVPRLGYPVQPIE